MQTARASEHPRVSVLIATCGDAENFVRDVLQTVRQQADALGGEVVVVVNRPSCDSEVIRELADVVVCEARPGKSRALNTGVAHCRALIVAFTDDDTQPEANWLAELVAPLLDPQTPERVVGCGGTVQPVFSDDTPEWFRSLVERKASHFLGPRPILPPDAKEYSSGPTVYASPLGANCAYRRALFDEFEFDPSLGPNYETGLRGGDDSLFGIQVLEAGHRILHRPTAGVRHPVSGARMTREYAETGYYLHGAERIRIQRALGRPTPSPQRVLLRLARANWRHLRSPWSTDFKRLRRKLRAAYLHGQLDELRGRFPRR